MTDLIAVASWHGREAWAHDASKSIERDHIVVYADGFELGVIRWCLDNTVADRIIFLQDSMLITDNTVFDRIAATTGSICLCHYKEHHLSCYLGVYECDVLDRVGIPKITDKLGSYQGEWHWTKKYIEAAGNLTCFDTPQRAWGQQVERRGRLNSPQDMGYAVKFRAVRNLPADWESRPWNEQW